ncbi:Zn-ribbon domain-containing OB-fold protein [Mycolicibacterium hodleri]|uniref:Zn-ribbon domain-containing OB-fold protein n=1 Tax=Mycolicibacterium hodleri TaxID=49897 RepID=A0A502EG05_9MYCO|nr:Zn-ribbon domain-containing OB-fold protein [Mycolicibacterium hodleri]TPG36618.1 Zn-ribbon domain-containing OB-fold protein [Mycolicibacterium hodleri]
MTDKAVALPPEAVHISTDSSTLPFWEAAKEGRLVAPQCGSCGTFRLPPTPFCPACRSTNVDWPELSGLATVFTFSVVRGYPGIPDITLVPAVLDLPDAPGARLVCSLIDVDPDEVHIGMSVTVDFAPISDGWQQPVFRPIQLR